MSAPRSAKSHVIAWLVAVFVGVPVLYFLSVPPICMTNGACEYARYPLYESMESVGYSAIYDHIGYGDTPLRDPLVAYWRWWEGILYRLAERR